MIRRKSRAAKLRSTRVRKLKAVLRNDFVRELPENGIRFRRSKATGEMQEFCVTPEAMRARRLEIWMSAKGNCELCAHSLGDPEESPWHWHHKKFRSQGGDDSLGNAQALCIRCHDLLHRPKAIVRDGGLGAPFTRGKEEE